MQICKYANIKIFRYADILVYRPSGGGSLGGAGECRSCGAGLKSGCRIKAGKQGVVTLISKAGLGDEPPKVRPSVARFTRSEGWRLEMSSTNVRRTYGRTRVKQSRLSVAVIRHAVTRIPPAGRGFDLCQAESVPSRISGPAFFSSLRVYVFVHLKNITYLCPIGFCALNANARIMTELRGRT